MTNPRCPYGCGELAINGNRLFCVECGASPGFVKEPTKEGFERDFFSIVEEITKALGVPKDMLKGDTNYSTSSAALKIVDGDQ